MSASNCDIKIVVSTPLEMDYQYVEEKIMAALWLDVKKVRFLPLDFYGQFEKDQKFLLVKKQEAMPEQLVAEVIPKSKNQERREELRRFPKNRKKWRY